MSPRAVVFDVGNVLYRWSPKALYERLIPDGEALDAFMRDVISMEWHLQHDAGRNFAETSAELSARFPEHAELIALWGSDFEKTILGPEPGMIELVAELDVAGVPLFCITNFSHEFFPPFRALREDVFARFQDILVSGEVKLVKPDPAIYALALDRFGLAAGEGLFIDDNLPNVESANACGLIGHHFKGVEGVHADLQRFGLLR